jgi:hypothetical protein
MQAQTLIAQILADREQIHVDFTRLIDALGQVAPDLAEMIAALDDHLGDLEKEYRLAPVIEGR